MDDILDAVVVGAGWAGLSVSYGLRAYPISSSSAAELEKRGARNVGTLSASMSRESSRSCRASIMPAAIPKAP